MTASPLQPTLPQAARRNGLTRRRVPGMAWFFPAAAAYGALAGAVSVHGLLTGRPWVPAFAGSLGHAHEMLFGYGLAVVAGFLVTQAPRARLACLFGLWVAGRASFWLAPNSAAALVANGAFATWLAAETAPRFIGRARKLRNQALAPLLLALCLAVPVFHAAGLVSPGVLQQLAARDAVVLLALLMLFMGGRIIAPAAAGGMHRAGRHLEARVQPRIEGALLAVVGLAAGVAPLPGGQGAAGVLCLLAALLALVRLLRWRLWACPSRPDLWSMGVGYLWLVAGLALTGLAWTVQGLPASTALHAITIGALGTLSTTVMARTWLVRLKADPAGARLLPWIAVAMSLAAGLRLLAPGSPAALALAVALWSLALLLLLALMAGASAAARTSGARAAGVPAAARQGARDAA